MNKNSDFRQIPDTQEVYVSMEEGMDISLVIDLNQRVQAPSDLEALDIHFQDVADDQGRSFAAVSKETITLPKMYPPTPSSPILTSVR